MTQEVAPPKVLVFYNKFKQNDIGFFVVLFFLFFALIFSISYSVRSDSLVYNDDGYLHLRRSWVQSQGESYKPPVYSSFSTHPVDLYFLYHMGMVPFFADYDGGKDYGPLIQGMKIYHSILVAIFLTAFCAILYSLLKEKINNKQSAITVSVFFTFILLFSSNTFLFRILIERPQVLGQILGICVIYSIIKKKPLFLFSTLFLAPFFFSATFILLIPPIIYLAYIWLIEKSWKDSWRPLAISLLGLAAGIVLRPDSFAYFYNGYVMHVMSLFNALFLSGHVNVPAEFLPRANGFVAEIWQVFIHPLIALALILKVFSIKNKRYDTTIGYLSLLTIFYFLLNVFVSRAIEYFLPTAFMLLALLPLVYIDDLKSLLLRFNNYFKKLSPYNVWFIRAGLLAVFCLLIFVRINFYKDYMENNAFASEMTYSGLSKYLETNATPEDLIYMENFGAYPMLYFFNPYLSYTVGIDLTSIYTYDPKIFWYINHIIFDKEETCPKFECKKGEDKDTYEVFRDVLRVKYIVINTNEESKTKEKPYGLNVYLKKDTRYQLVFQDPKFENMKVYELMPEPQN